MTETRIVAEERLGLSCRIGVEHTPPWVMLTLDASERGGRFKGSFRFHEETLRRRVARLRRRLEQGKPKPLLRWPHRPFGFLRRKCRFLGTLRGEKRTDLMRFAIVPLRDGEALEVSVWDAESCPQLPLALLAELDGLLRSR